MYDARTREKEQPSIVAAASTAAGPSSRMALSRARSTCGSPRRVGECRAGGSFRATSASRSAMRRFLFERYGVFVPRFEGQ